MFEIYPDKSAEGFDVGKQRRLSLGNKGDKMIVGVDVGAGRRVVSLCASPRDEREKQLWS